jgi:hypothetical protein
MNRTIFYSWQSDLPNSTNRSFIESVINKVISDLKNTVSFSLELSMDKDTSKTPGTPDIANTIFNKISKTSLFIADISIINSKSKHRKTPNPNVLIELGYAAKAIGWERILCVYNSNYGGINDLPFDLRHRRPLVYSLAERNKNDVKIKLVKKISKTVDDLARKGLLFNEIQDLLKKEVDTEILTLINWLSKIVFGYSKDVNLMLRTGQLLNLNDSELEVKLSDSEFLGFQVFKTFEEVETKLKNLLDKVISSNYFQSDVAKAIVNIIDWVGCFNAYTRGRSTPDLFQQVPKISKEYNVLSGRELNPENIKNYPNRYILLKKINKSKARVLDFGDFTEMDKIKKMLHVFKLSPKHKDNYIRHIHSFIKLVNDWLDLTNGEFILDTYKHFEMKLPPNN